MKPRLIEIYLAEIESFVESTVLDMPQQGEVEIFGFMKRLVHKIGFLCWVSRDALDPKYFSRLVDAFEVLDPESRFVLSSLTGLLRGLARAIAILTCVMIMQLQEFGIFVRNVRYLQEEGASSTQDHGECLD